MKMRGFGWKKNKNYIVYFLTCMVLVGIMLIFSYSKVIQAKEAERVVKIGIYELPGFCEVQDDGYVGYNMEYLAEVAELTGWKYEYVVVSDYEAGRRKLEQRKIDLLAPSQKNVEEMAHFLYSEYSFGRQYTALITEVSRADLNYEVYEEFQGMRVAVVEGSSYTDNFSEYAQKHSLEVEYVYGKSTTEVLNLLHSRKVDAAVVNLMEAGQRHKVLARFSQMPFYYLTYQGNEVLLEELNEAMYHLQSCRPKLINDLTEIYLPIYEMQYMTAEQRYFIDSSKTIRVGYVQDNIPVSYTDAQTGEFKGITRDILDKLQELSGLTFEYVPLPQGSVDYSYLLENHIVITADVTYNRWNRRAPKMVVTMPYDDMNKVMIGKQNMIFYRNGSLRLAMSSGSQTIADVIAADYPNFKQLNYRTTEEAFDAVINGEADVLLVNQYVADYWLGRPLYSSLGIIPAEGMVDDHCLAVLDYADVGGGSDYKMIKEILDVAISKLTENEVNMIIFQNMLSHRYQYTWKDFVYENWITLSLALLVIALVFVMQCVLAAMRKKNYFAMAEKERKLAIQQKRYELIIEKSEDIIFETDLQTGEAPVSGIMREKFGWSLDDFKASKNPDELMKCWKVHKDDVEILKKAYLETRMESKNSECVVRLVKKDVGYVWCKVRRYPILNEKGEVVKVIGNIINIDEITKETQRLKTQTRTDSMTGLLNKKTFLEEVAAYLREAEQTNFCMVFFDLDHFKQVNDCLGHLVGDAAIKEAAQKLQVNFANVDLVSRFGGDEFCIFVKNIPLDTLNDRLEHTREKLVAEYQKSEQTVKVTASIGAVYYHVTEKDVQAILDEADKAVYEAKETGRNKIVLREIR